MKEYRTYEDWNSHGCYVKKGEKATKRNEKGIPLFSESQVAIKTQLKDNWYDDETPMDVRDEYHGDYH